MASEGLGSSKAAVSSFLEVRINDGMSFDKSGRLGVVQVFPFARSHRSG